MLRGELPSSHALRLLQEVGDRMLDGVYAMLAADWHAAGEAHAAR
jgi:hypothetical protein